MAWTVIQGQEIVDEIEPDTPDSCISGKYCITGDGDGMPDGWEIQNGLSPLWPGDKWADPDGDALTNYDEFVHGTDPFNIDTDDDGCHDGNEVASGLDPLDPNWPSPELVAEMQAIEVDDGISLWDAVCLHGTVSGVDSDNDGLPDWLEDIYGTNPNFYDTDGDGLPDGWEVQNGLNPLDPNDAQQDFDGDGLSNHDEYVYGGDPTNADTDGDGTSDADEVAQGSEPGDASDGGQAPDPEDLVLTNISIGDPSGSHSEHWELRIGPRNYKAPGYGEVACWSAEKFVRGKALEVRLVHLGSNMDPPDLDHIAWIEISGESDCAFVHDPDGILTPLPAGLCSSNQSAYDPYRTESFPPTSFDDERAWLQLKGGDFTPDPETHHDDSAAMILPGDEEKVFASMDELENAWFVIANPNIAKIKSGEQYVSSLQAEALEQEFTILGYSNGETRLELRKGGPSGTLCGLLPIRVGGSVVIEYDQPPTFIGSGIGDPGRRRSRWRRSAA